MIRVGVLSVSDGRQRVHDGLAPYIAEQAGTHFDPAVVPVFIAHINGEGRDT